MVQGLRFCFLMGIGLTMVSAVLQAGQPDYYEGAAMRRPGRTMYYSTSRDQTYEAALRTMEGFVEKYKKDNQYNLNQETPVTSPLVWQGIFQEISKKPVKAAVEQEFLDSYAEWNEIKEYRRRRAKGEGLAGRSFIQGFGVGKSDAGRGLSDLLNESGDGDVFNGLHVGASYLGGTMLNTALTKSLSPVVEEFTEFVVGGASSAVKTVWNEIWYAGDEPLNVDRLDSIRQGIGLMLENFEKLMKSNKTSLQSANMLARSAKLEGLDDGQTSKQAVVVTPWQSIVNRQVIHFRKVISLLEKYRTTYKNKELVVHYIDQVILCLTDLMAQLQSTASMSDFDQLIDSNVIFISSCRTDILGYLDCLKFEINPRASRAKEAVKPGFGQSSFDRGDRSAWSGEYPKSYNQ